MKSDCCGAEVGRYYARDATGGGDWLQYYCVKCEKPCIPVKSGVETKEQKDGER